MVWFEVGHWVCWFWCLLGMALVQAKFSCHLARLGMYGRSYKVICGWLPLLLGLQALGRGYAANRPAAICAWLGLR